MQINFKKVFPSNPLTFDGYRTVRIAAGLFIVLSVVRSCIHLVASDGGARSIAGIDTSVAGGDNIIALFHLWGAMQLLLAGLLLVLFIRYPGLSPLILLTIALDPVMRAIAAHMKHVTTTGTPPGEALNWPAFVVLALLFFASLVGKVEVASRANYIIYFNQQWVGDHSEEWFQARGPLSRAVVDEMREAGVVVFAGGLEEEIELAFGADETGAIGGPITTTGEFLGGMTIIEVASDEEAKMWGAKVGEACGWPQEIRKFKGNFSR